MRLIRKCDPPTRGARTLLRGGGARGHEGRQVARGTTGHKDATRARGALLTELTPEKSTLEDVFVDLVKATPEQTQ